MSTGLANSLVDRRASTSPAKAEIGGENSRNQPDWLTEVAASVIHAERGTAKQLAFALGVALGQVYDAADRYSARPLKAWWLPTICEVTGSYALLDVLERRVGRVAFELASADRAGDAMQQALAREVTAFGEFLSETASDMADGRIDPDELQRILPAIDRILARTCEFRSMVIEKAKRDAAGA